ncbi:MAG: CsgG/HfaB family protein [Burkholderiaceae bacterium]|nr:CsgG/HfaB family protein [Burkholderiaceae bacterium]
MNNIEQDRFWRHWRLMGTAAGALLLAGCPATLPTVGQPEVGGGSKTAVTGAAGGATTANANSSLERCDQSLGTIGVVEDQNAGWYHTLRNYKLGSTVPVLRMMIQQSNCFVVVERGAAMRNMNIERNLQKSGEMRGGSSMGPGQMVAADYTMSPEITFSQNTGGMGGGLAGLSRSLGVVGALAGSLKTNEASTTLIMIDNRSGVQLAAAEGSAKNTDFNVFGSAFGWAGGAGAGGYSSTPEGKIIIAAFADSYNQLVKAVRNYKAQTVKGGLGTGGTLGVQGGATPASKEVDAATKPVPKKK